MKKIYVLMTLLCSATFFANAQFTLLAEDSTVTGVICTTNVANWYRIITPTNGMTVLYTTASVNATQPGSYQYLGIEILGKDTNGAFVEVADGQSTGSFFPYVGVNTPSLDTSYTCCMTADTFYIRVDESLIANLCWSYTLRWHTIPPTYPINTAPDSFPVNFIPMPYNTPVTDNLGFESYSPGNLEGRNDFVIVPPTDGTLKVNVSVEAEDGVASWMDIQPYDHQFSGLAAQYANLGAFQSPADTSLYWNCFTGGDTFYISTNMGQIGDGGFSYRMSYTVVPPVFNNDSEPNNTFAEAQAINPAYAIEGHIGFEDENDDDYFMFYKPDTGFLTIHGFVESAVAVGQGDYMYVDLYDSAQNTIKNFYPFIGGNSVPLADTMTVNSLPAGWYYLHVQHTSSCVSYKFLINTPTISGIHPVSQSLPLSIFPNPSSASFTVDFGDTKNTTISIYNAMGQLVESTLQNNERYVVVGEKLTTGLYFIKATNDNGEIGTQGKLVKTN